MIVGLQLITIRIIIIVITIIIYSPSSQYMCTYTHYEHAFVRACECVNAGVCMSERAHAETRSRRRPTHILSADEAPPPCL